MAFARRWVSLAAVASLLACGADPVGSLGRIYNAAATLDGKPAAEGDELQTGSSLTTNETGSVEFELAAGLECRMLPRAEVAVPAAAGVALQYRRGKTWCQDDSRERRVLDAVHTQLRTVGTVFSVTVDERSTRVEVLEGAVEMQVPGGGAALRVQREQQAEVTRGRLPRASRAFRLVTLGAQERALVQEVLQTGTDGTPEEVPQTEPPFSGYPTESAAPGTPRDERATPADSVTPTARESTRDSSATATSTPGPSGPTTSPDRSDAPDGDEDSTG